MDVASQTSLSLLERAKQQDADAWNRLAHLYTPLVYAWCRQCRITTEDAGDVMQEVFQAVHRTLDNFRRDRAGDTFRGWLWMITRNKVRDHFRAIGHRPQVAGGTTAHAMIEQLPEEEPLSTSSVAGTALDTVFLRGLDLVKSEFEEKTWQAFWRFAVDGAKAVDVAKELEMSPGAVRKAKLRVMRRLREELGDVID